MAAPEPMNPARVSNAGPCSPHRFVPAGHTREGRETVRCTRCLVAVEARNVALLNRKER